MANAIQESERPWLNSKVLEWARKWRGRTLEEAASRVGKDPLTVEQWESGTAVPTVRQARVLAEFYERPFLELLLNELPNVPQADLVADYRMHAGHEAPQDTFELKALQQWVETQRANALDLFSELDESPPEIPRSLFTTIGADEAKAAEKARHAMAFTIDEQFAMDKEQQVQLPEILRNRFESLGILVLRRSDLKEHQARGICIAVFPLPAIVFGTESPTAQAFTLAHELAHILIRASGIIGPRTRGYRNQPVERWCDSFAGAFLMPASQIELVAGTAPKSPKGMISDEELKRISAIFRVSQHAMLIRLVHLGYVTAKYYWETKKPEFDNVEREYKRFGRATYYGSRYKSQLGKLYTGLVLDAWSSGLLTNHNAAEFMGIKNLRHLHDIRDNFQP